MVGEVYPVLQGHSILKHSIYLVSQLKPFYFILDIFFIYCILFNTILCHAALIHKIGGGGLCAKSKKENLTHVPINPCAPKGGGQFDALWHQILYRLRLALVIVIVKVMEIEG